MRRVLAQVAACALGVACCGCVTGGEADFVEMNFKRISAEGALVERVSLSNASWWVDEGEAVHVALGSESPALLGAGSGEQFDMSIVVSGLAAAGARDYPVTNETLRACHQVGANHTRYASMHGIVALWFEPGNVLRGRYRIVAIKELFHILTGWTKVGQVVAVGEFVARPDHGEGKNVLERSEAGMKRTGAPNAPSDGRPKPVRIDTSTTG